MFPSRRSGEMLARVTRAAFLVLIALAAETLSIPALAEAEPNPLAGLGGELVYIDPSGSLLVLDGDTGATRMLVPGSPGYSIRMPAWSPDGTWISFMASPFDALDPNIRPREDDIYVIRADGSSTSRRVTHDSSMMGHLDWFPDSQVLAYGASLNGLFAISRVNLDGAFGRPLYARDGDIEASYVGPVVSPNGQSIASVRTEYDETGRQQHTYAYVSAADGSNGGILADMGNSPIYHGVSWLSDGSGVIYVDGGETLILQAPLDGTPPQVLVQSAGFIHGTPSRSQDGTGIAYVYNGGQVLGDSGPTVQWRLSIRSRSELSGRYWTDVNPDGKLQWVSGTKGLIYENGDSSGPRALRVLLHADGTPHTISQLSNGSVGGFDWHGTGSPAASSDGVV